MMRFFVFGGGKAGLFLRILDGVHGGQGRVRRKGSRTREFNGSQQRLLVCFLSSLN